VLASQAAMALENSLCTASSRSGIEDSPFDRRNVVGVVISDLDGRVSEANNAYLDMVGYTRDDLVSGESSGRT